MAISPKNLYPSRVIDGDGAYPYGKALNVQNGVEGTGTPLEAEWLNDIWGSQQALLAEAGIAPNGQPDSVGNSQYLDALKKVQSDKSRESITALYKAQGYNNVFFFEDGFTYTEANDVGVYSDGTAWTYADAGALPVDVDAGAVPSEGVYSLISMGAAKDVAFDDSTSVQDYKDNQKLVVSSKRFIGTAGDDAGSPDGVFVVNRTHGLETSPHSFKDNTVWYPPVGEYAMASYDAYARIYDENITDHFIDYQSRSRKYGSAICKQMWGFASSQRVDLGQVNKYTGFECLSSIYTDATCTSYVSFQSKPVVHGDVTTLVHFQARPTTGIGTLGTELGVYLRNLEKADADATYPIYVDPQREGVRNLIQCPTENVGAVSYLSTGTSIIGSNETSSTGVSFSRNYDAKNNARRAAGEVVDVLLQSDGLLIRSAPSLGKGTPVTFTENFKVSSSGDVEILGAGKSIIAKSPDGTRYKLTPPNGGGAATWAAV